MPQTIPEEETKPYHIFGDETSVSEKRFLGIGTTIVSAENRESVSRSFTDLKAHLKLCDEIKWERVRARTEKRHEALVDMYFDFVKANKIRFHSMLIPLWDVNHRKHNEGIPDIGYSKWVYHLLLSYTEMYPARFKYYVDLDERTTKQPPRIIQDTLNFTARNNGLDHWPFRRVHFRKSHEEIMIQMTDLIVGAIGFRANRREMWPETGAGKRDLSLYIFRKSGAGTFTRSTASAKKDFTIWRMRFKDSPRPGHRRIRKKKK